MAKGTFSQGMVVLTDGSTDERAISEALAGFEVVKDRPAEAHPGWIGGNRTWILAMRPEVNGYVAVDLLDLPWPDDMGDPKANDMDNPFGRTALFAAWSMGFMCPHSFPGNLARARQFAPAYDEQAAGEGAAKHRAFVRVRSSYVFGADNDAKILPPDYDPVADLRFVTSVSLALARASGALCVFNPGGETLFSAQGLERTLRSCDERNLPPLPAWCGQRIIRLDDQAPGWHIADTVGMEQILAPDQEAVYQPSQFDAPEVAGFARDISLYTWQNGPVIKTGHTTDGPGGLWRALLIEQTMTSPPRPTIRWYSDTGPQPPASLLPASGGGSPSSRRPPNMPTPTVPAASRKPSAGGITNRLKSFFGR